VSPAVSRILQVVEVDNRTTKRRTKLNNNPSSFVENLLFVVGNDTLSQLFNYTTNITVGETENINTFDIFINNDFYGSDITEIQINTNDVLKIVVQKDDDDFDGKITLLSNLI
jgi:hypothetical protein